MNRTVLGVCLSLVISLLMTQVALAEAYRHDLTGIVFPDSVATLEKEARIKDYEAENPGLGVSIGYNGPGITVTVYVYTMGIKTIPSDLESPILKDHFKQTANDIVRMAEIGYYSNVKKISDGEATWGEDETGMRSLHAFYSFTQGGRDRLTHLYLMGFQNYFLKVRFTYNMEIQETAEKTRKEFLGEFSQILGGVEEEKHSQRVQATQVEKISKPIALKAIGIFENEPLSQDGEGAASIITQFATESEEIYIVLSDKIITWLGSNDKGPYDQYRAILLAAYLAGNVKSQIVQGIVQDDPYSGLLQVLKTYHQLQEQDTSFYLQEIEVIKNLKKNKHLKEHIKKALSDTKPLRTNM